MLLRSSSTPILGSLHSSFTDSPNNNSIHSESCHAFKHHLPPCVPQHHHQKISFHQSPFMQFSCTSSPISPSISEGQCKGFRRVQSEGNLEDLAIATCNNNNEDIVGDIPFKRFSARPKCMVLETIPSFSVTKHKGLCEEDADDEETDNDSDIEYEKESGSLMNLQKGMVLSEEVRDGSCRVGFAEREEKFGGKQMYLARGLGVDVCVDGIGGCRGGRGGGSGGGGGDYNSMSSGGNDGDRSEVEEYYKKMLEENPGNPLFLRNYAQYLYQCKEDHEGAEEYYSRAILADPEDGDVLSQYGKLVWELHKDEERASAYFERAVQASPEDSHVHAAYASFLWDTEEGEDDCNDSECLPPQFHQGAMATAGA
ncbi:hypothetical protein Ahy_B06g081853 [Arachis hypogaea]|uniref:TmcB/TmcC TPR repeats domain-containing protein n=1 Tax=Arachis hypogaea TaxID=3818 RepID=A0A444YM61_ARAHY|nr:hypothetical protein Ahy_B06g081853 [Arachis hypogaea]